jgi:NAD+ kinase
MTQRPIILPTDREISLSVERQNGDIYVTLDGQLSIELHAGDVVRVNRSQKHVLMVCSSTHNYFGVLRAKLLWGAEGRQK